ncbi:hypothetical protein [Streptomyces luteolus]|uniref:Uncharacterized protein n=1 Tax=Streptomyces luteolus TaxID=3043615 RepID=A0ABT6ST21_9ACTN|nr:hypothetical protein [Streptomyces sp. B-S-A12]MDI3418486.1 hypothetical protein [Streptomyces sp. B-S-A12]
MRAAIKGFVGALAALALIVFGASTATADSNAKTAATAQADGSITAATKGADDSEWN